MGVTQQGKDLIGLEGLLLRRRKLLEAAQLARNVEHLRGQRMMNDGKDGGGRQHGRGQELGQHRA